MGFRDEQFREIGGWKIHSQVGEGGFGRVFLAYNGDRRGALKVLRPDYVRHSNPDAFRQSFESEADILAQLRGPHTAQLFDANLSGYTPWLVTRFVPGDTLAYQVKFENPVRGRAWWDLAHGLFSGLAEAHSRRIIHRDIKPSNVMRSADVPAVIIDFGIALFANSSDWWKRAGTDVFQSPEQRLGRELSTASDIYSAALTLLYVTTRPRTPERQEFTKAEAPGVPFVEDIFERSSSEAEFLRQALARDPSARPSAEELAELSAFHSRFGHSGQKIGMALPGPQLSLAPPGGVMSRGGPERFALALPARSPKTATWAQVKSAVMAMLRVKAGQAAHFGWVDDGVEVSAFGLHTPHVVLEIRSHHLVGSSQRDAMVARGWGPPEDADGDGWLLILPGGRSVFKEAGDALLEVTREVIRVAPSKPERF
jgi:hypothetical protein